MRSDEIGKREGSGSCEQLRSDPKRGGGDPHGSLVERIQREVPYGTTAFQQMVDDLGPAVFARARVEVCRRAGLSRGAAHHHYDDVPALLADTLEQLYTELERRVRSALPAVPLRKVQTSALIDALWAVYGSREYIAAVELWIAQTHDSELRAAIQPAMSKMAARVADLVEEVVPVPQLGGTRALTWKMVHFAMAGMALSETTVGSPADDVDRARMRRLLARVLRDALG